MSLPTIPPPCSASCDHEPCGKVRELAARVCRFCGRAIGYQRPYHVSPRIGEAAHAECRTKRSSCDAGRPGPAADS